MVTEQIVLDLDFEKPNGNGSTNYLTHNFHPYPAKFIPQIPRSTILKLTKKKDTILDPFCGCGTTLVEAKLLDRNAIGIDLNPIAVLVSKAKTNFITISELENISKILSLIKRDIHRYYENKFSPTKTNIPKFKNLNHWFQPNVIAELSIIKSRLKKVDDVQLRNYLYNAFSAIIVNVSNQEK